MKNKQTLRNLTISIFLLSVNVIMLNSCKKEGCTDSTALNYDENAKNDDGSCEIIGCMDPNSSNYNPKATENSGDCILFREQFIGNYNTFSSCIPGASYDMEISTSATATNKVLVFNANNLSGTFSATVLGNILTIDNQSFQDELGDTWTVSSNSGNLIGNTLTITVTYNFSSIDLICNETWNKQ